MRARLLAPASAVLLVLACSIPIREANARPSAAPRQGAGRAASLADMDDRMAVNSLDMVVTNRGSVAYDLLTGGPGLIYPKGTANSVVFAAGIWMGAKVNGQARVALAEYGMEFTPGPMQNGTFIPDMVNFHNFEFDAAHPLTGGDLADYTLQGGPLTSGGQPLLLGDAEIWSVFNDADPGLHTVQAGLTPPLGIEVQQSVFAFNRSGALGNVIYLRWKVTNKGANRLDSAYVAVWSDPDLGGFTDDLVGCDTTLSLGYCYNATNADAQYGSTPPAVGFTLVRGPAVARSPGVYDTLGMTSFVKYMSGTDPVSFQETYNYLRGRNRDGSAMHVLDDPALPETPFAVSGLDPGAWNSSTNWIDTNPADRRITISSGPFTMEPGQSQDILVAICVGRGANRLASIADMRNIVSIARLAAPPPPAPAVTARLDLEPWTIQLRSRSPWLTAYIEPETFDPASIDPATVVLAGSVHAAPKFGDIADHDSDGWPDLMLKFPRAELDPLLSPGVVSLELTGALVTGESFTATAEVRVLEAPNAGLAASLAPNPLNPSGTLRFTTPREGPARVRLYDARGRLVRTLFAERALGAGPHEIRVDGRDGRGAELSTGIYWFRIEADGGTATGRFALLK